MSNFAPIAVLVLPIAYFLLARLSNRFFAKSNGWQLRPLSSYKAIEGQVSRAIESNSQMHVTVGQGSLYSDKTAVSTASLIALGQIAEDGCANETPPLATTADATLFLSGLDSMYRAYEKAGQVDNYTFDAVKFMAHGSQPVAYMSGVASLLHQDKIISNIMLGHFGPEVVLSAEAAYREHIEQVIGTDNITAMSIATAYTDHTLIGEDMFAAPAYVDESTERLTGLRIQDVTRTVIMGVILLMALLSFLS